MEIFLSGIFLYKKLLFFIQDPSAIIIKISVVSTAKETNIIFAKNDYASDPDIFFQKWKNINYGVNCRHSKSQELGFSSSSIVLVFAWRQQYAHARVLFGSAEQTTKWNCSAQPATKRARALSFAATHNGLC